MTLLRSSVCSAKTWKIIIRLLTMMLLCLIENGWLTVENKGNFLLYTFSISLQNI